jgi:hypothetical protein
MLKRRKILLIEDKEYYERLGVLKNLNTQKYEIEFNGLKRYKMTDDEIATYYAIISILYTNPISNLLILKAKKNGVRTILLCDGVIDWANLFKNPMQLKYNLKLYHPIIHDLFVCVGEDEKEYFESLGNEVVKFMPKRIINNFKKIPLPHKNKFLITTANTAYFDDIEKEFLLDLIQETIKELNKLNIDFIYRIYDKYLIERLDINESDNYVGGSFDEVLELSSAVITTPSSISINAMYHERPVGHFLYRDTPMFIQSGWLVSKSFPISDTLISINMKSSERMDFQNYQIKKYLKENDESNILEEVLERETSNKDDAIINYINSNLYNIVNSKFNINFEYLFRKHYLKLKKNKVLNKLLGSLRQNIK